MLVEVLAHRVAVAFATNPGLDLAYGRLVIRRAVGLHLALRLPAPHRSLDRGSGVGMVLLHLWHASLRRGYGLSPGMRFGGGPLTRLVLGLELELGLAGVLFRGLPTACGPPHEALEGGRRCRVERRALDNTDRVLKVWVSQTFAKIDV